MSQHDFNIANQTFPNFRADLNNALVAAATMSAGSSAPTTPYGYQLWFDTTTGTWKVRNSGNTAWVSTITTDLATGNVGIGTASPTSKLSVVSGTNAGITVNDGTVNTILFNTSSANGSVGTTTNHPMAFYANNAERMRIDSAGRISINTTAATELLNVAASAGNGAGVEFAGNGTTLGSTSAFYGQGSGSDAYVWNRANNPILFGTNNAEKMRIDSSGNVGIGTSSPDASHKLEVASSGTAEAGIRSGNTSEAILNFGRTSDRLRGRITYNNSSEYMAFWANQGEKMRIDSSGALLVNTTSRTGTSNFVVSADTNVANPMSVVNTKTGVGTEYAILFYRAGSIVGSIQTSLSATSYVTSSDYRLKTAVEYDWDATSRLKQLKPARFAWIADGDDAVPVDGFLAHEVQDIVPEAISGTKDAMVDEEYTVSAATGDIYTPAVEATYDEDGVEVTAAIDEVIHSADVERPEELAEGQQWRETTAAVMGTRSVPDYQGIDQSKLVPLLVKTIQELEARITALEAS